MPDPWGEIEGPTLGGDDEPRASARGQAEVTNLNEDPIIDSSRWFSLLAQLHRLLKELDDRRRGKSVTSLAD
jgi:hypothetical protein